MKLFLKKLEKIFSCALLYFEHYFLGQKSSRPKDNEDFFITLDNQPVRSPVTLFLAEDRDEISHPHNLACRLAEKPAVLIAITPDFWSHREIKLAGSFSSAFLLKPKYIEQIIPMTLSLEHHFHGDHPIVVVLFYISQMPCKKDLISCISSSTMHSYDQAYTAFLMEIKRIVFRQKQVVIVDREETLGKKNSALVRRMFRNN